MDVLNRIYLFVLIMSSLNILRHLFFLIRSLRVGERFVLGKTSLILLGSSISYVLMSIIYSLSY